METTGRQDKLGRPRTPDPSSMGMQSRAEGDDDESYELSSRSSTLLAPCRTAAASSGASLLKTATANATTDDIFEQVMQSSIRVSAVAAIGGAAYSRTIDDTDLRGQGGVAVSALQGMGGLVSGGLAASIKLRSGLVKPPSP